MALYPFGDFMRTIKGGKRALRSDVGGNKDQYSLISSHQFFNLASQEKTSRRQLEFENGCIIDHLVFGANSRTSVSILFEYKNDDGEWIEIRRMTGYGDGGSVTLPSTPQNIVESTKATNGMWEILEYDTDNFMYVLKLRDELKVFGHFRISFFNSTDSARNAWCQVGGRELK